MITCSKCKRGQPADQYRKDRSKRSGLHPWCKACRMANSAVYLSDPSRREANLRRTREFNLKKHATKPCKVPSCDRLNHMGWDYCSPHGQRVIHHGDPREDIPIGGATRKVEGPCWVYLAVDTDGVVRYVGVTSAKSRRISEHRNRSWWFPQITLWHWAEFSTATHALSEEKRLIAKHAETVYNVQLVTAGEVSRHPDHR